MWSQPWVFWIGRWHLGHGFVLETIHLALFASDFFVFSHSAATLHDTGRWLSAAQRKQKVCEQKQTTSWIVLQPNSNSIARSHPAAGHLRSESNQILTTI